MQEPLIKLTTKKMNLKAFNKTFGQKLKFEKIKIIGLHLFILVKQKVFTLFNAKFFYSETDYYCCS